MIRDQASLQSFLVFIILGVCLSTDVTAQALNRTECSSQGSGWISNIQTKAISGRSAFTSIDVTWSPMPAMDDAVREYVVVYKNLTSPFMFSDLIIGRENYRIEGLQDNTTYKIGVCKPSVNVSFLSQLNEPFLTRECGWCYIYQKTNASEIEVILATHYTDSSSRDYFQCQAYGLPRPTSIIWTAINPNTGNREQIVDDGENFAIYEEILTDRRLDSVLETPSEFLQDLDLQCNATNDIHYDIADVQQFFAGNSTQPDFDLHTTIIGTTQSVTTQTVSSSTAEEPEVDPNESVKAPDWAIGLIVGLIVTLLSCVTIGSVAIFCKFYFHSKSMAMHKENLISCPMTGNAVSMELPNIRPARTNTYTETIITKNENGIINSEVSFSKMIPKDKIIPSNMIELSKVIGQGEFGVVYKGKLTKNDSCEMVAVKTLKGIFSTDLDIKKAIEEILKMQSFDHPNVMTLIGVCMSEEVGGSGGPSIVMPYMSKGSLLDYLRKEGENIKPTLEDDITQIGSVQKLLTQICVQIAKGMEYLASLKFVHRDLAARNCMIRHNGFIKVGDFGLTEDVYLRNYFRQSEGETVKLPIKWMALESLKLGVFSEKSDVWSYGVTCWEVFTAGEIPYPGVHPRQVIRLIEDGERLDKPKNEACSDDIYALMLSCWESDPKKRPTFSEIVVLLESQLLCLGEYLDLSIVPAEEETVTT